MRLTIAPAAQLRGHLQLHLPTETQRFRLCALARAMELCHGYDCSAFDRPVEFFFGRQGPFGFGPSFGDTIRSGHCKF